MIDETSKIPPYRPENFCEFLDIALVSVPEDFGGSMPWWRGQADESWNLFPSIHHQGLSKKEISMTIRFRNLAKVRYLDCPTNNQDYPRWLFLMQHHGLPTRLLDWTRSPLTALFFAVEEDQDNDNDKEDAAIWALNPLRFNEQEIGEIKLPCADSGKLYALFQEAFEHTANTTDQIAATLPFHTDLRHLLQQAVVTIHGSITPINALEGSEEFLRKIIIPGPFKKNMRDYLYNLSISKSTLFPDLESLAKDLVHMRFGRGFDDIT